MSQAQEQPLQQEPEHFPSSVPHKLAASITPAQQLNINYRGMQSLRETFDTQDSAWPLDLS